MQVAQFKSRLSDGGARPNQFRVNLQFPGAVGHPGVDYDLLVTGAAIPASTVNPVITQFRGREVKFAGERIFDPWTITVINSADFKVREQFEAWMELINNKTDNSGNISWDSYQVDMSVEHLDRNNVAIQSYTLVQAFPINMSEIALQYAQNDIIEEFTVTFQYQHYIV
tara:strand:+ start:643 stop:1149 length:507 start_codon:yes stop_codon:yes gene_type:complete